VWKQEHEVQLSSPGGPAQSPSPIIPPIPIRASSRHALSPLGPSNPPHIRPENRGGTYGLRTLPGLAPTNDHHSDTMGEAFYRKQEESEDVLLYSRRRVDGAGGGGESVASRSSIRGKSESFVQRNYGGLERKELGGGEQPTFEWKSGSGGFGWSGEDGAELWKTPGMDARKHKAEAEEAIARHNDDSEVGRCTSPSSHATSPGWPHSTFSRPRGNCGNNQYPASLATLPSVQTFMPASGGKPRIHRSPSCATRLSRDIPPPGRHSIHPSRNLNHTVSGSLRRGDAYEASVSDTEKQLEGTNVSHVRGRMAIRNTLVPENVCHVSGDDDYIDGKSAGELVQGFSDPILRHSRKIWPDESGVVQGSPVALVASGTVIFDGTGETESSKLANITKGSSTRNKLPNSDTQSESESDLHTSANPSSQISNTAALGPPVSPSTPPTSSIANITIPNRTSSLTAMATSTLPTSTHVVPTHPHSAVVDQIVAREGRAIWRPQASLSDHRGTLKSYWNINANPVASYVLGSTTLVVCQEGVYQLDESGDYCRWRGRENQMESGPWEFSSYYYDKGSDSDTSSDAGR
jgi:hypothetical protein